jgi:transcriptional regulator with XRE-family HTH domain
MSLPFNQALVLWRRHRRLTQDALAQRARLVRPHLSAIERGQRDVTLSTLRALAVALDVRPGLLVDGAVPGAASDERQPLSRQRLERIAKAVVHDRLLKTEEDRAIVDALKQVVGSLLSARHGRRGIGEHRPRAIRLAWLWLRAAYSPEVVHSLVQRIRECGLDGKRQSW